MIHPTLQQLSLLGYQAGDRVYARLLLPKNIPLDVALRKRMAFEPKPGEIARLPIDGYLTLIDGSFSFTRIYGDGREKHYPDGLSYLSSQNRKGYGIYNVVNPGGRYDEQVTSGRVLFYECDDCSKDEQWARLRRLETILGKPASDVTDTAKSLHCYFTLEAPLAPGEWTRMQQRLIQCQDSDPSIWNPSRLMRLPGFLHWKWDKEASELVSTPVTIAQATDSVFTLAQFDLVLPEWDSERWGKKSHQGGDRIPTNAGDDQWDIRNFAHHLEGFNPNGRKRGWATCKCPAHNGESDNSLHINLETGAFKCHAECSDKAVYHAALAVAKAAGHQFPEGKRCGKGRQHPIPLPTYELTYPIAVLLNSQYLGDVAIPRDQKLIGLKGRKGCGKTWLLERMVENALAKGQQVLVLTHRRQLGHQLANRFGLAYKDELSLQSSEGDRELGLVICFDSAHPDSEARFNWADWTNALIIIDESESGCWHVLDASTCSEKKQKGKGGRGAILQQIQGLMKGALSPHSSGQIVLADADLSNLSIDFVLKMAEQPHLKPYIVCNEWREGKGWTVLSYPQVEALVLAMEEAIATGGRQLIETCAQKTDSKWSSQNIERHLKDLFPCASILRIDSDTVADPEHPAYGCVDHINATLAQYEIVICTPVLESGVSIELFGYFQNVWTIAPGVIPENSVRQFMARLRDNDVPRHLYAAERGCNFAFVASGEHGPKALLETTHKVGSVNLNLIKDASFSIDVDGNVSSNPAALETWGKMGARINQGMHQYQAAIHAGLEMEGHSVSQVEMLSKADAKVISQKMAEVRNASHQAYCEAVPKQPIPANKEEYEAINLKRSKTAAERLSCRHWELNQKYLVDITADLVKRDSEGAHSFFKNHYYLTDGAQHLKNRDRERFQAIAVDGVAWVPDINKHCLSGKMEALERIGFKDLLHRVMAGDELTDLDLDVQLFFQRVLGNANLKGDDRPLPKLSPSDEEKRRQGIRQSIKQLTRVEVQPTAIATVQEYFSQILGFRLMRTGQRTVYLISKDGGPVFDDKGKPMKQRIWIYRYPTAELIQKAGEDAPYWHPFDGRQQVMDAWLARDKAKQEGVQHELQVQPAPAPVLVGVSTAIALAPVEALPAIEESSVSAPVLHTKSHIDLSKAFDVQCVQPCAVSIEVGTRGEPDWAGLPPDEVEMYRAAWLQCDTDHRRLALLDVLNSLREVAS
ncbi:hypothetical protein NDI52_24595 [Leptolyngbya sp. PL-A3]|uniref:plasmid replication protein, CyRepA1 family n=1 Tax=Leptolyngbya sp. PL-A3 TaxID=2933911 RepID=UPI0032998D42